jgi:ABC-type Na+ efflux pump permease subunit
VGKLTEWAGRRSDAEMLFLLPVIMPPLLMTIPVMLAAVALVRCLLRDRGERVTWRVLLRDFRASQARRRKR